MFLRDLSNFTLCSKDLYNESDYSTTDIIDSVLCLQIYTNSEPIWPLRIINLNFLPLLLAFDFVLLLGFLVFFGENSLLLIWNYINDAIYIES